jgi:hypothetical protein
MFREDGLPLAAEQERSYANASKGLLDSYPKCLSMNGDELAAFLGRKLYAVLATTRPDGRAQAAPVGFIVWKSAFWIASVQGARVNNLKARAWASIVVAEGEPRKEHRAVVAEGRVNLYEGSEKESVIQELASPWQEKHGHQLDWAAALIELIPEKLFSFDGTKERKELHD